MKQQQHQQKKNERRKNSRLILLLFNFETQQKFYFLGKYFDFVRKKNTQIK